MYRVGMFIFDHHTLERQGLGNCALYNGTYYAAKDVISVVVNYRLGAFGFLASDSMEGNYGLKDQRMALQWVQANIKNFGGNPAKVTVGGQSAGAMSAGTRDFDDVCSV
jgi:para-nitrobenzyl esterase